MRDFSICSKLRIMNVCLKGITFIFFVNMALKKAGGFVSYYFQRI